MNFQTLTQVRDSEFYLDVAFKAAKNAANLLKTKKKQLPKERLKKSKFIEVKKIEAIKNSLYGHLNGILVSFPSIDSLPPFYRELVKVTVDYYQLKKSLGAVNWCRNKVIDFFIIYRNKIQKTEYMPKINQFRREFYGRVSSLLKQIDDELKYLDVCRKILKGFPTIKTSIPTICIFGFPNVGKTTLLYKLTGSKPEINSYPFTTKTINVGYLVKGNKKIQLLDTPGSLDRFNQMNAIEKQAYLALKYLAEKVIYVFDLTEPYPLEDQMKLYETLKNLKKEIFIYVSKTDMLDRSILNDFKKKFRTCTVEELKEIL